MDDYEYMKNRLGRKPGPSAGVAGSNNGSVSSYSLRVARKKACETARQLCYPKHIQDEIKRADSEAMISRLLREGRKGL